MSRYLLTCKASTCVKCESSLTTLLLELHYASTEGKEYLNTNQVTCDITILDDMLNIKSNYCNPIRVLYVENMNALKQERCYEMQKSSRNQKVYQEMIDYH